MCIILSLHNKCNFPPEHGVTFIGRRPRVPAQTLIAVYRQPYSRVSSSVRKRKGDLIYSAVLLLKLWCQRLRKGLCESTILYKCWDTLARQVPLVHRLVQAQLAESERQRGTDTLDNGGRVVEKVGNGCVLPIKVPSVPPPDRCFLFVPVRLAGSSLHSIVVCPRRGHEDTFIMFSENFLLMRRVSGSPWPPLPR